MKKKFAYYNENDPFAAQWIRNLIAAGHVAPGEVDERSIKEVKAADIKEFTQCHFFAGIAVWSYALKKAGWPDDREVWTGSCPCQPFSVAGRQKGFEDDRHLWPEWFRLIRERKPPAVFGEQVAGKDGEAWLDLVWSDMESLGYAFGPTVLPAAGFGAPHGRHRIFFVGDATGDDERRFWKTTKTRKSAVRRPGRTYSLGNSNGVADSNGENVIIRPKAEREAELVRGSAPRDAGAGPTSICGTNGFWKDAVWIECRDGKTRPIPAEPGLFPLADGTPARVGKLRAAGNAVCAPVAEEFIRAYLNL